MDRRLRPVTKKEIPLLFKEKELWDHEFLSITKHRLLAHFHNPTAGDDDTVLILAYLNDELVGYMGAFIDTIRIDLKIEKIAWLSTWWVHPKTKGTGVGRSILQKMYELQDGKIGISQFTPSAKRVYEKSGYFYDLKNSKGIKFVLRSNIAVVLPLIRPQYNKWVEPLKVVDGMLNFILKPWLWLRARSLSRKLNNTTLEYLNALDPESEAFINRTSTNHIAPKSAAFFAWLKQYHWVQEAPLLGLTPKDKYEFSSFDSSFNIYLVKVLEDGKTTGFLVLQKRDHTLKVLFAYYENASENLGDIVLLHAIKLGVSQIITYDDAIVSQLKKRAALYKSKKVKESIISKQFGKEDFSDVQMNFGDGDCSFA